MSWLCGKPSGNTGRIVIPQDIIGVRRGIFDRDPRVAVAYKTFEAARLYWQRQRLFMAELTPWILADIEDTSALMGPDWQPGGVSANTHIIRALCEEQMAQRLVTGPVDPESVFAEFEALLPG